MNDTKILLKQSGERFVIRWVDLRMLRLPHRLLTRRLARPSSRVASDLNDYDATRYGLTLRPSTFRPSTPHASTSRAPPRFHLGEPIVVDWKAPENHSRQDWIGIYRLEANKSKLVTRVSSQGKWVGVHDEEWEGSDKEGGSQEDGERNKGVVRFEGKKLPWTTGTYEIR